MEMETCPKMRRVSTLVGFARRVQKISVSRQPLASHRGFTMLELLIVVAVIIITTVIAIPLITNIQGTLRIRGAATAVTATIQATRYQAILQGCNTAVVFDAGARTAQPQTSQALPGTTTCAPMTSLCNGQRSATPCPRPLSGSGANVALDASQTLTFTPGGRVLVGAAACPCTMVLTYRGRTANISVSSFGSTNAKFM